MHWYTHNRILTIDLILKNSGEPPCSVYQSFKADYNFIYSFKISGFEKRVCLNPSVYVLAKPNQRWRKLGVKAAPYKIRWIKILLVWCCKLNIMFKYFNSNSAVYCFTYRVQKKSCFHRESNLILGMIVAFTNHCTNCFKSQKYDLGKINPIPQSQFIWFHKNFYWVSVLSEVKHIMDFLCFAWLLYTHLPMVYLLRNLSVSYLCGLYNSIHFKP